MKVTPYNKRTLVSKILHFLLSFPSLTRMLSASAITRSGYALSNQKGYLDCCNVQNWDKLPQPRVQTQQILCIETGQRREMIWPRSNMSGRSDIIGNCVDFAMKYLKYLRKRGSVEHWEIRYVGSQQRTPVGKLIIWGLG